MARIQVTMDWDAAKADIPYFVRKILRQPDGTEWEPFEAQESILRGIRRNTVLVTGRQFGKTTILGWKVTHFAVTRPHSEIWILAPTLDQTKIVFREVAQYFRTKPLSDMVVGKIHNSPFPEIELKNGTMIRCRGLNHPEFVRGNRAHLAVVDEAAFVKDGTIKEVVEPLFGVAGKREGSALILTSTPFGKGEFYEFTDNAQKRIAKGSERFNYFNYSSYDNPHFDREQLDEVKERYGEDSPIWLAEYMGIFQDDEFAVFPTKVIKRSYELWPDGTAFPIKPLDGHRYVQGIDLANERDYFVSSVYDVTDRGRVLYSKMERYRKRGYAYYKGQARANYTAYFKAKTIVDATSLGESVAQDLTDISVIPYKFSGNEAKWQVVQELSRMMQEERLAIPFDKDIIAELSYFRYIITPSKVMRMEAPRGKHDDIVMSMALAAHLACVPVLVGMIGSVPVSNLASLPSFAPRRKPTLDEANRAWLEYMKDDDEDGESPVSRPA